MPLFILEEAKMASESIVRDMFRSLETTIHERLAMIADVILMGKSTDQEGEGVSAKLTTVLEAIQTIDARLTNLEMKKTESAETVHVNHIGKLSPDIWTVSAMPGLEINLNEAIPMAENMNVDVEDEEVVEEEVVEEEVVEEEVVEEEAEEEVVEEEVVEEAEEEVVEEAAEEEAEEEEGEAVDQFTYKGKNYYRDSSNQVYAENADGEPDDTVVGIWDPTRERLLFKRV